MIDNYLSVHEPAWNQDGFVHDINSFNKFLHDVN